MPENVFSNYLVFSYISIIFSHNIYNSKFSIFILISFIKIIIIQKNFKLFIIDNESMSILTGREILNSLNKDIIIDPFNIKNLNPNSYNLTLHDEIKFYDCNFLDMKKDNPTKIIKIPNDGLWLEPGETYLGRTIEYTVTKNLVPIIKARSSIARLHINIINSAGFGDIGYSGHWTIPISVIKKTKVYPFVTICQIYYSDITGEIDKEYNINNKYQNSRDIMASKIYKEFESTI